MRRPTGARTSSWPRWPTSCATRWLRSATGLQVLRLTDERSCAAEQAREMMERQLAQLVRLVDDLLDISRISRNKLELRKARIPLASVIENAVETARRTSTPRAKTLTVTLPPEPVFLDADLTRLAQVFWNLLNNSAKYTDPGGHIELSARSARQRRRGDGAGQRASAFPPEPCRACSRFSRRWTTAWSVPRAAWGSGWRWSRAWWRCTAATSRATARPGQGQRVHGPLALSQGRRNGQNRPSARPPPSFPGGAC